MAKQEVGYKNLATIGMVLAIAIFMIVIVYPIAMTQHATSFTCGNTPVVTTNCSWGASYNADAVMSSTDYTVWSNIPTFAILVILAALGGIVLKAMGFF